MSFDLPTDDQEQAIEETFNALRSTWNLTEFTQLEIYEHGFMAGVNSTTGEQDE